MVGEHIRARRDGRWVHAIDCGDETVIQLADDAPGPANVRRSYRPTFVAGAEAVEVVMHRERTFAPGEVVARAYSRIADPALAAMFRDSEAFAAWCATGRLPPGPANAAIPAPDGASPPPAPAAPEPAAAPPTARRVRAARTSKKRPSKKSRTLRAAAKRRPSKRAAPARKKAKKRARRASKGKRSRR